MENVQNDDIDVTCRRYTIQQKISRKCTENTNATNASTPGPCIKLYIYIYIYMCAFCTELPVCIC